MRKRATGLTSIPMADVPGSENVEIGYMEPEDAEAANHGGFNQMEVGDFAKDMEFVNNKTKKSANYISNITKVSKDMKKELIKLNSALNGLGYKNLIKTAEEGYSEANNGLVKGKFYKHKKGYIVECTVEYSSGTNFSLTEQFDDIEAKVKLISPSKDAASSESVDNMNAWNGCIKGSVRVNAEYTLCDNDDGEWASVEDPALTQQANDPIQALTSEQEVANSETGNLYYYSGSDGKYANRNYWIGFPDMNTVTLSIDGKNQRFTFSENKNKYDDVINRFKNNKISFTKSTTHKAI